MMQFLRIAGDDVEKTRKKQKKKTPKVQKTLSLYLPCMCGLLISDAVPEWYLFTDSALNFQENFLQEIAPCHGKWLTLGGL